MGRKAWVSEPEFDLESDDMPLDFDDEASDYAKLAESHYDRRWDEETVEHAHRAHRANRRRGARSRSHDRDDWDER